MYRRMLIALDGSANSERVLPVVQPLLSKLGATAVLCQVLHSAEAGAWARAYLRLRARRLEGKGIPTETVTPRGDPALQILRTAASCRADLVALTTHGRGAMGRWILGSVAHKVLRTSPIPVLLAKGIGAASPRLQTLLVPLDGSRRAEAALPHATALARALGAALLLLHVAPEPGVEAESSKFRRWARAERRKTEARLARLCETFSDLPVRAAFDEGDPAAKILERSERQPGTLVVISSHGRTGIQRWAFGSVTEKVLQDIRAPMLILRS